MRLRDVVEIASRSVDPRDIERAASALRGFAAAYRSMVAIPAGENTDAFFAWHDAVSRYRHPIRTRQI